jgi:2-amino-4-hydroxy-6-hydroxymethyldihydropteridine diphosphokinase
MESNNEFLNACLLVETELEPSEFLNLTRSIERSLGREPGTHFADRVADIDILWWEGIRLDDNSLKLPHPGLFEREFVMRPLSEIVLDEHQELGRSIDEALKDTPCEVRRVST